MGWNIAIYRCHSGTNLGVGKPMGGCPNCANELDETSEFGAAKNLVNLEHNLM
ncbi:MAG: hypothetical protein ACE5JB_12920 [bacterium]